MDLRHFLYFLEERKICLYLQHSSIFILTVVLPEGQLMSVADMLKLKSIPSVLDYHQMLRELITS